jgi:hypothetical protein
MPAITLQAGYYFTWMSLGFANSMEASEKISMDFRNDSYFAAIQISKDVVPYLLTLFVGTKVIRSFTVSEFGWESFRPTTFGDRDQDNFPTGVKYHSGTNIGDTNTYLHFYGGLGLSFGFPHLATVGFSYNIHSQHFAINAAVRLVIPGSY